MAGTITATYNSIPHAPGYDLALGGLTGSDHYTVVRHELSGQQSDAIVRGADTINTTGNTASVSDYELSFAYQYQYVLTRYSAANAVLDTATSATAQILRATTTVTSPFDYFYLNSVATPSLTQPITMAEYRTWSRPARAAENVILNRQNPVFIQDVLGGRVGSFKIIISSIPAIAGGIITKRNYDDLLTNGGAVFLLQSTTVPDAFPDLYFVVTGIGVETLGIVQDPARPVGGVPHDEPGDMLWYYTINFAEVDRPSTLAASTVGATTWQVVKNNYATWTAVAAANSNWQQVSQ